MYRRLGRTGLEVSALCLGTMMFGGRTDAAESHRIVDHAAEHGINFIDTADAYNAGRSEEIVGDAMLAGRSHWVLATKVANQMGTDRNHQGLSRRWVRHACEQSLRRLKTDCIDIYYLHREDPATPLEETVSGLADLIRAGKIRYIGVSNFRAWRMAELCRLCDAAGIDRPAVCQPYYNAMNRMPEVEVLPCCAHYGMGVVPYSPLSRGVLTAKYDPSTAPPAESRAGQADARMMETEWRPESLNIAHRLREHCAAKGSDTIGFAIQWLLANPLVSAPIAGPRTMAQWQAYLAALDAPFDAEDEALLNDLVPPGHASTPGYSDPKYPVEGRPTA